MFHLLKMDMSAGRYHTFKISAMNAALKNSQSSLNTCTEDIMETTNKVKTKTAKQQTPAKQVNKTNRAVLEELRYAKMIFPEFFMPATMNSHEKQNQEALLEKLVKNSPLRADMELLLSLEVFCKG